MSSTDAGGAALPRPEYPRPMFARDRWLNLNGTWEFQFDDGDKGLDEKWYDGRKLAREIVVPFPYQAPLSGINDKSIHEIVWYARTIEIPADWKGCDIVLHFGAVDYRTTVWVNGEEVGHNRGGHVPFEFDIAPYLRAGANRLSLRVEDSQDPSQPRGKQSSTGIAREIDYYCTTGIWQTVWLEPAPPQRINDIRITPIREEEAFEIHIILHASADVWTIEIQIEDDARVVARASKTTYGATATVKLVIPGAHLWSPDSPHLYNIRVTLLGGGVITDTVFSYAGMRSIELRQGRYLLNGRAIFLAMVLDQGYWPEGYLAAPSDEALKADVEWIKRFGYNGVRKHQKIEDPRWLYWCDRLGLLVWEEMPNARAWSSTAEERLLAEWERAVYRDANHPCIITWVPVNESMGFPGLRNNHPGQYDFLERMVSRTRRFVPSHPVIDNDGWEHTDVTDVCAIHDYTSTSDQLRARYREAIEGGELPTNVWLPEKPLFMTGSRYRGQPIVLTEVGGFLMIPQNIPVDQRDVLYKYYGSIRSHEELLARYRDLLEGIASLPFVAGFCYTQLTDIEQEINGLLTYDRVPKVDPAAIADVHRRLFLSGRS